jgi:hypothetical protein
MAADDDDFWVVEVPDRRDIGNYREVAPSAAEAERVAADLRKRNVEAKAYRYDPGEVSKLGSLQRAVLQEVQDNGEPVPKGTSYEKRCRIDEVARKMQRRGFITSLPYNHPSVIAGRGQYLLTRLGKAALRALQSGRALPKKRR